jgi:putative transposase
LTSDTWGSMLSDSVDRATQRHGYSLMAFVYMPEHVHLLVFPRDAASRIDELLRAIKRPFSYRVKQMLLETGSPLLRQLTVRQRPNVEVFRFWQEGPGYDRNLVSVKTALGATAYIHLNPVRRGLVACELDWRWSSARLYNEPWIEPDPALPSVTPLGEAPVF